MKKLKKIFSILVLVPSLFVPSLTFATDRNAPVITEVKVEDNFNKNSENQNTLDKKIEEAHEVKSKEESTAPKDLMFSPWASSELNDVQFMGLFPISSFSNGKDFTKAVTREDANAAYNLAKEKIESRNIKTGGNFNFKNLSRLETLESISKLLNDDKFSIKSLKDLKIFLGEDSKNYLNEKIPLEEMLSLYNRAVKKVLQDNDKVSKGFFYEINNKNNKVYMLGSIHVGRNSLYPIDNNIVKSLKNSDKIYMEIDLTDQEKIAEMQEKIYYKDGRNLKDDLGEELYERVLDIFKNFGMTEDQVKSIKPWAIYNTLSIDPNRETATSDYGVESYFLALSLLNKIEIDELESVEFQSDLLSNFDKESYISMIKNLTYEIEKNGYKNINAQLDKMIDVWEKGDKDKMKILLSTNGDKAAEKFNEALLSDRDKNMAKKIDTLLKEDGKNTYFILIGSAHLVPENSVTGILKSMGYNVIEK
ncbi:MAG: TraB/GumN family protein [Peptoniphilus lacydonensis]|jgi:gumN protein|uniref:TraB/GumN family protein n=1 Tax=Peptoniphilus TaxID=162289 RepID=UPI000288E6B9|nr:MULTISPECIES: TraB/GumN family protein [Peptoniphilus]MDU5274486.1 TraB/GumN family protein [Peptoniphilus lacydonensis]MDU7302203.1 TraB/GumN family protein [Peptoniphilus lacydonensis]